MTDTRIVYGMRCTWWDSIHKVGHTTPRPPNNVSIPCCPSCGGVLFELSNEEEWWRGVDKYETDGHPGYRAMMTWARGKCYPNMSRLKTEYEFRNKP